MRPPARSSARRRRDLPAPVAAAATALTLLASAACADGRTDPTEAPTTSPAAPTTTAVVQPGAQYVALGGSFASGPGIPPVADEACFRSQNNYPNRVAAALKLTLVDVTCVGSAIDDNVPVQIEGVTADTQVVTITIGGNDVGYAPSLDEYACLDTGQCAAAAVDPAAVELKLATIADRLVTILDAIKASAPQARVLLVTYPVIVPPAGDRCPTMPLTAQHAEFVRTVGARLDVALKAAAARSGARLVDVYAASSPRGVCEPNNPWVSGLPPGTPTSGQFAFHPTAAGMQATADLIVAALTSS